MKKRFLIPIVCCAVLVALVLIGRVTGAILMYNVPSGANEPAIEPGDKIFVSKLKQPTRFDFICYRATTEYMGSGTYVSRLCGLPGDEVEIREGVLYVNGKNVDEGLNLKWQYSIGIKDIEPLSLKEGDYYVTNSDSAFAVIETSVVAARKLNFKRHVAPASQEVPEIEKTFSKKWNHDHFGPVQVPKDHYFVLGDNRNASLDSRFLGFIPVADWAGTVLWK